MPYKPTGKPPGRPKVDRDLPLISADVVGMTGRLHAPEWWITMATLEAEWRVAGKWRHGSLKDLARNFTSELGGGKSAAAVNKTRRDRRYLAAVNQHVANLKKTIEQDARDPMTARADRVDLRADISAAIDNLRRDRARE
jgi:hypothetical protein